MALLNFTFSYSDKVKKLMDGTTQKAVSNNLRRGMEKCALLVEGEVKRQLSLGPKDIKPYKTVKVRIEKYRYPKNLTKHLRVRTGRLRQSVRGRVEQKRNEVIARIGPQRVIYARVHEVGFKAIPARPYLEPSIKSKKRDIIDIIRFSLREAIR